MEFFNNFASSMDKYTDARSKNYFLLQGLTPLAVILSVYFAFCYSLGPHLMKSRPAFQLKNCIFLYNLLNVFGSLWLVNEVVQSGCFSRFGWACGRVHTADVVSDLRIARIQWVYFMMKIFELLDTIFFVLRKKDSQVTLLHLYHHTSTPILAWIVAKFAPVGPYAIDVFLNTGIHVIMYTYYLLSSLGPKYQKYLWWKKYLTAVQIVQLFMITGHHVLIVVGNCGFSKTISAVVVVSTFFNLYQFVLFFRKSYAKDRKLEKTKQ